MWNSHNINLTILRCNFQWYLVHLLCKPPPLSSSKTFSSPLQETPNPLSCPSSLSPLPSPWQPPSSYLCLQICLFWTFHIYIYTHTHTHTHTHTYIYKIIQYVTICAQILLLSIFSRLIHVIACIVCYFIPYYWKYYFIIWTNHILSIHLLMEIQLLDQCQFWAIVNSAAMSICVQVFAEYLFSIFWVYTWKWDCWVIWYSMLNLISLFF